MSMWQFTTRIAVVVCFQSFRLTFNSVSFDSWTTEKTLLQKTPTLAQLWSAVCSLVVNLWLGHQALEGLVRATAHFGLIPQE